ncbi:hypothetical protein AB0E59_36145 [Lentzea sp. NPDC034063]|uniref:hypothetical protein n=1 Tax=unclassified Lentzea TaxID=2643253 RepID=UPI0033F8B7F2
MIDNPQVAMALAARWRHARTFVLTAMVGLPLVLGLVCLAFAALPHFQISEVPWWSAIPVLVAAAAGISLVAWLRHDGLTDPASWFPATVLMTGTQLFFGVVPGFGIAARTATGTAVVMKALLALGFLSAGSAWTLARRACRSLLASPVAELGSTPLQLTFRGSSSRVVIGVDRVDWEFRAAGGRLEAGVSFRHLHEVSVTVDRADGGTALALHTSTGTWAVPSEDAVVVCDVLRLRKARWEQRVEAAVEQERERYHEMALLLASLHATSSTDDGSVSVTVNADGITTHVELGEGTRDRNPQALSAELMTCLDQARTTVRAQARDLVLDEYVTRPTKEDLARIAGQMPERFAA